jgi:hypothetical protein
MEAGRHAPGFGWDFWAHGLDRQFFGGVYKRSTQASVLAALLAVAFEQRTLAIGLVCGLALGLFSIWTVEATVRLLFSGGQFGALKLAIAAVVKMPFMLAGLVGIAWACFNGHMNVFGVVGGVLITHATTLVLVLAAAMAAQDTNRERYR